MGNCIAKEKTQPTEENEKEREKSELPKINTASVQPAQENGSASMSKKKTPAPVVDISEFNSPVRNILQEGSAYNKYREDLKNQTSCLSYSKNSSSRRSIRSPTKPAYGQPNMERKDEPSLSQSRKTIPNRSSRREQQEKAIDCIVDFQESEAGNRSVKNKPKDDANASSASIDLVEKKGKENIDCSNAKQSARNSSYHGSSAKKGTQFLSQLLEERQPNRLSMMSDSSQPSVQMYGKIYKPDSPPKATKR